MIDLNKDLNIGQMLMNFYEPTEMKKNNNQGKEVDSVVGTKVTVIKAAQTPQKWKLCHVFMDQVSW